MPSPCSTAAAFWILLSAGACAQEGEVPTFSTMVATFGTTVVVPGGLTGRIYELQSGTTQLPKFEKLEPVGTIYTRQLFVPPREFTEGFPGVTSRFEWFAIDYTGRFYVADPGVYRFSLESDDGSKLYIDNKVVINADGVGWLSGRGSAKLAAGIHHIRVSYFQGPRYHLYLMLTVAGPRDKKMRPFNTDDFKPPSDLAEWNVDVPEDLTAPVRRKLKEVDHGPEPPVPGLDPTPPNAGRRSLKEEVRSDETMVPLSVRVISGNQPVSGLTRDDFEVRDGKLNQELSGASFRNQALDLVLLVDSSVKGALAPQLLQAAVKHAAGELGAADRVGVMEFGEGLKNRLSLSLNRQQLEAAFRGDESPSGERLQARLQTDAEFQDTVRKARMAEDTKELNSALAMTALALRNAARIDSRRAIVILTNNLGAKGAPDRATRDTLWRTNVLVYGLLVNKGETGQPSESTGDVRQFIEATGGEMFNLDGKRIPLAEAFRSIRDRYLLTYKAPGGEPKSIHSIAVELSPAAKARYPDAEVLVRGGYVVGEEGEKPPLGR